MEEGVPENLAHNRLRIAVGQFKHFIEIGAGTAKTLVKSALPRSRYWLKGRRLNDDTTLAAALDDR